MARTISYMQAINEALAQEMERDETVVVFGEDNVGGAGSPGEMDAWGGVLGVTKGLYAKYPDRILDTPISESAFIGAAAGAACSGLRPVAELMFVDFFGVCMDQIYNQAAKFRCRFGGKAKTPMVIRTMFGAGIRAASQHSQSLYQIFTHIPGLKVVIPSNPYDAKGLLIASIRDDDPVMFFENKVLYAVEGEVPEEPYAIPLGEAEYVREGDDVTIEINNAIESPAEGVLRRRVAKEGEVLPVGGLLGVIAPSDVPDEEIDSYVGEFLENFDPEEAAAEAGGPEPQTVEIGGRNVQYLKIGEEEGPPLILLHGFGGDINIWVFNQEALSEAGRTVYALDLPGHGQSSKDVGEGNLDSFMEVLAGFVDEMGVEKAHLVGHSMGGAVAGSFALALRERVASLVLIASAGVGEEINEYYIEGFIAANRRREMKNVLGLLFANPDLVTRRLVNDELRFKRMDGVDEALRAVADKMFSDGSQTDVPDLSGLDVSILVIWGQDDQIIPVSHTENLPDGARVEILEDTGHMPQMESAGRTNRLIGEFLDGLE